MWDSDYTDLDEAVKKYNPVPEDSADREFIDGMKVPVIMTDYDYYYMTAVRAVKANGNDVFDEEFFEYCGLEVE